MGLFGKKMSKEEKEQKAADEKANAEFEASYTAKMEKKKVEKLIQEIEKSERGLLEKAALAKSKGYSQNYAQCLGFLKVARARKAQAEKFLFQMDAMQEMQNISKNSSELLASMQEIAGSLGKLTLDKTAMQESQRNFMKTQQDLDKQSMMFETYLGGMEFQMSDESESDLSFADPALDAEVDSFMLKNNINASSYSGGSVNVSSGEMDEDEQFLKSLGR